MNTLRVHHGTVEIPEAEIRLEAHRLWLEKGAPDGHDVEIWFEAKELLKHRLRPDADASAIRAHAIHFPPHAEAGQPKVGRMRRQGRA